MLSNDASDHLLCGCDRVMLKTLIGIGLGFLLFSNPDARQLTGDLLRSAGDAVAPAKDGKLSKKKSKMQLWRN